MHNVHRGKDNREHHRMSRSGPAEEEQGDDAAALIDADAPQSLDLNHATAAQLATVEGLDLTLARVIVEHRVHHGHYISWDELGALPGMTDEVLQSLQRMARLGGQADGNGRLTHH